MSSSAEIIERFKRQVVEEWQHPLVTAAYRKWSREEAEWGRACRDLVLEKLVLMPGLKVLDVGSAHGEPALAIAEAVGPSGHVTMIDVAPALLEIAHERARAAGLMHVTIREADAHDLPFADDTFDRISCRFAAMYFADHATAFREALRVLKPAGRATYVAWGRMDQPMFSEVLGVLFQYVTPPEDEAGAPSPFVFAASGSLSRVLSDAGFTDVAEEHVSIDTTFPGTPEQWWDWFVDVAVPVQGWIASLSESDRRTAVAEIHAVLGRYYDGATVRVPIEIVIGTAQKPS